MSRRGRAVAFFTLALGAAALAAALVKGYGSSVVRGYGALRPVVVATSELRAGSRIDADDLDRVLAVRRVPARFVPPRALAVPARALGLVPEATIPAGSYVLGPQLRVPRRDRPSLAFGTRRRPVEIAVSGGGALLASGLAGRRPRVDVAVTTEPRGAGAGRTYVAAEKVPLIALEPGADGPGGLAAASLALTRKQALKLISAQNFARQVTLIPVGAGR